MWCREQLRWRRLWWWWRTATATATATASCHRHRHCCCCWWQQQQRQQQHHRRCLCHHHAEEAKIALVAAKSKAGEDTDKYFDLVSIACGPGRGEHPSPLAEKYRAEIEKLKFVRDGEWHHGFNNRPCRVNQGGLHRILRRLRRRRGFCRPPTSSTSPDGAGRIPGAQFVKSPVHQKTDCVIYSPTFVTPSTQSIELSACTII